MSQPASDAIPFATGWYSFDLGQYRPCDGTYCFFTAESLPPLNDAPLDGTFQWLTSLSADDMMDEDDQGDSEGDYDGADDAGSDEGARLAILAAEAQRLGLTLPAAFISFMTNLALHERIPSCTACEFALPTRIVPSLGADGGYLISFLHDQQDVLLWYLYLTPAGEQRVVVSPYDYDGASDDPSGADALTPEQRQAIVADTFVCAASFEEFIYRFWLENTIWFALDANQPLNTEQQRYVAHYS